MLAHHVVLALPGPEVHQWDEVLRPANALTGWGEAPLVLESLQAACRDGAGDRHPRSAEWEHCYGRAISGQDCAAQLAAVERWHRDDQRDTARLHALAWGQRPQAGLARAIGAKAGEADWDERVASQLTVFAAPGRGTLREAR
jgi:hypothetical protein